MSDDSGNGGFVLHCLSGRYAEVHISKLNTGGWGETTIALRVTIGEMGPVEGESITDYFSDSSCRMILCLIFTTAKLSSISVSVVRVLKL